MPTSIVPLFPQPIDNRSLSMDIRFYMLNTSDVKQLATLFLEFSRKILTPNVVVRSQHDRKTRYHLDLEKDIFTSQDGIGFLFEADFTNSVIHNVKTFRQFDNYLQHGWPHRRGLSDEYMTQFNKRILNQGIDYQAIRNGLVELFTTSNEIPVSSYPRHDASGSFQSIPYWFHPGMYHGQFRLSIAKECLGSDLTSTAESMAKFVEDIAIEMRNIGGTVRLAPYSYGITPYKYYFGNQYTTDGSHESAQCYPNEWYPFYYHDGIEWFNLLTPLAADKIKSNTSKNEIVKCKKLAHDGLVVQSSEPIGKANISDYLKVKNYLYAALIPGMSQIPLKILLNPNELGYLAKPRMDWEIIPISSEEICVEKDCVIFKHII